MSRRLSTNGWARLPGWSLWLLWVSLFVTVELLACSSSPPVPPPGPPSNFTLTWVRPPAYLDGAPIPAAQPITYTVFEGPPGAEVSVATGLALTSYSGSLKGVPECWQVAATDVLEGTTGPRTAEYCYQ